MFRTLALSRARLFGAPTAALFAPATHPYAESLTVTPRCFDNIKRINKNEQVANDKRFLRLAIESGGCQGFSYKFYFDDEFDAEEDIKFEISNATADIGPASSSAAAAAAANPNVPAPTDTAPIPSSAPAPTSTIEDASEPFVVADKETLTKMKGGIIDYHTELKGSAFVVIGNEFVDHSCACAQSFSLRK